MTPENNQFERWTDETIKKMITLHNSGATASQIANQLGGGTTRNAVIGKLFRLKLSATPLAAGLDETVKRKKVRAEKPERPVPGMPNVQFRPNVQRIERPIVDVIVAPHITGRIKIEHLTAHTCRWPIGDPRNDDFHFCGAVPMAGKVYCAYHREKAVDRVRMGKVTKK
jgi:GcrA cell cycle regulator